MSKKSLHKDAREESAEKVNYIHMNSVRQEREIQPSG